MKVHTEGKLDRFSERALVEAALRTVGESPSSTTRSTPASPQPHRTPVIPGYSIIREIHRGGQGVVYQAVRESTGRTVAIKVMREGPFAGLGDRVRFEREVRLLAQLDHPNIVAVHDSGEAAGCYFFVMDYVHGEALDAYVESEQPGIGALIELFAVIAEAVNAAHVRGIIHRDLKPGNVVIDAQHVPKILDFGLAKVAGADAIPGSSLTISGQFLGSLPWSSPEQAEGKHELVDVRTDVYALGVMFFQMLTGKFPYEVRGTIRDVMENIITVEPQPPSTIRRELDDEIGTILLTALAKEPERRYQTAGELARDLRRYLADEPISAKRDSSIYVLRKTLRRHRVAVSVTMLFVGVLVAFGVVSALQYIAAREAKRNVVTTQLAFLERMFASINPDGSKPESATVQDLLADATHRIDVELANEPEAQADVRQMLGVAYKQLGEYSTALVQLEQALALRRSLYGEKHPKIADTLHELGAVHWFSAEYGVAEDFYSQALAMRRELFGDESVEVADTLNHLGACKDAAGQSVAGEELLRQALDLRTRFVGPDHAQIAGTLNNLAVCLRRQGRYEEAAGYFREALDMMRRLHSEVDDDNQFVARGLTNLAGCLMDMRQYAEAGPLLTEALAIKEAAPHPDQPSIATTLHRLAELSFATSDYDAAVTNCEEALSIRRNALRPNHPSTAASAHLAGKIRMARGDAAGAEPLLAEALRIRQAELPPGDPQTLDTVELYASCLTTLGRDDEAAQCLEDALAVLRNLGIGNSPQAQRLMAQLAALQG